MSWGWKIFILYTGFAAAILFMVFRAGTRPPDMVTSHYYEKELAFEARLEAARNYQDLAHPLAAEWKGSELVLTFPVELHGGLQTADIHLYRPASSRDDLREEAAAIHSGQAHLAVGVRPAGYYILMVSWSVAGKAYFCQQSLYLPG